MVNKLFGKKLGMAQYFLGDGESCPVTVLKVWPCFVTQKKTVAKEGYNAIQVGYDSQKEKRVNKPLRGHFGVSGAGYFSFAREIRVDDPDAFELGQELGSEIFEIGASVDVIGISKGRGFSGAIKRWGFSGGPKTHGCRSHRVTGSIGSSATPGRVQKGKKMPGRYGQARVTIKNLKIVDIRPEMHLVMVRGSVPGSGNSPVEIRKS
jgi:large subunit ribosomal protein L3